jgi:hypothetical protein
MVTVTDYCTVFGVSYRGWASKEIRNVTGGNVIMKTSDVFPEATYTTNGVSMG